jgi:hypothetical protein
MTTLALLLSGCQWFKASKNSHASNTTDGGEQKPMEAEAVLDQPEAPNVPTQEPRASSEEIGSAEPTPQPNPEPEAAPCEGLRLVIATDQLGLGNWNAQIEWNGINVDTQFTSQAKASSLCLKGLPPIAEALLTLQLKQGENLRFIARLAKASYVQNQTQPLVIDNCRIFPAPWDGRSNDGSCEWTISEVGPH